MGLREELDYPWEEYWREGPLCHADRQHIIRSFLPLVRAIARRLKAGLPRHVSFDDLVGSGTVGLIAAADRFDPAKGHHFRRYAAIRIRGAMLDELRAMDWAPRSVRREGGYLRQVRQELESDLGRKASAQEMAQKLGMDEARYQDLVKKVAPQRMVRLEDMGYRGSDADKSSGLNFIKDPSSPDPLAESEYKDSYEAMVEAVADLKERQRQMITFYYFEDLNLKEIAAIFGVTESRVSQIHSEAVRNLKKKIKLRG